jgi:hypothetical protein
MLFFNCKHLFVLVSFMSFLLKHPIPDLPHLWKSAQPKCVINFCNDTGYAPSYVLQNWRPPNKIYFRKEMIMKCSSKCGAVINGKKKNQISLVKQKLHYYIHDPALKVHRAFSYFLYVGRNHSLKNLLHSLKISMSQFDPRTCQEHLN